MSPDLKFKDPCRWKAFHNAKCLLKVYQFDLGCTNSHEFETLDECLRVAKSYTLEPYWDDSYYFRVFDANGDEQNINVKVAYNVTM